MRERLFIDDEPTAFNKRGGGPLRVDGDGPQEHLVVVRGDSGYCYTCDEEVTTIGGLCFRRYRALHNARGK
jgi:hypothetical protein